MPAIMQPIDASYYDVYVGDTTDIVYIRPSALDGAAMDGNWTCSQQVNDESGNEVIGEASVTEKSSDDTEFKVYLTPSQTGTLSGSGNTYTLYDWVIQVVNDSASPPYRKETHLSLRVFNQGIT